MSFALPGARQFGHRSPSAVEIPTFSRKREFSAQKAMTMTFVHALPLNLAREAHPPRFAESARFRGLLESSVSSGARESTGFD
jgi:hypothetical protein